MSNICSFRFSFGFDRFSRKSEPEEEFIGASPPNDPPKHSCGINELDQRLTQISESSSAAIASSSVNQPLMGNSGQSDLVLSAADLKATSSNGRRRSKQLSFEKEPPSADINTALVPVNKDSGSLPPGILKHSENGKFEANGSTELTPFCGLKVSDQGNHDGKARALAKPLFDLSGTEGSPK